MCSELPKVLHPVGGRPLVQWAIASAQALGAQPIVLVIGNGADAVRQTVGDQVSYAVQAERLGTGHATLQARELLRGHPGAVLVLYGDMPTLRRETLQQLVQQQLGSAAALTMLTVLSDDSMGFGRVVRDAQGRVQAVVEEAVATPEILALKELNCGVYCFDADWLWRRLPDVPLTQPKGEYYLTDMVALAVADGRAIQAVTISDVDEVQGVNTRVHLAASEAILRQRLNEAHMLAGVTLIDPACTYIDATVQIGRDTVLYPNVVLQGGTVIGERCVIGANSILRDTRLGDDCRVLASVLEQAIMEDGAEIGPFGHLRAGAHLGRGVHLGNFGEVKNAYLAPGVKMGHFSYVGDAQVGEEANIAAGTITCNYDGQRKHRTRIGRGAFVGSGTLLVAPVEVGAGAKIGAGSVVTHDVPPGALAYGVPARIHGTAEPEPQEGKRDGATQDTKD
jgi:bifunctional UDP-N-acetylglucosamine pyrophosphorylase/glucosamine-1-phosphate N-acetyltransferase